jgi:hypothetical protein
MSKPYRLTKKQKKFVPVYLFRRRGWEVGPPSSPETEIETESTGLYFITESSSSASPNYIITE